MENTNPIFLNRTVNGNVFRCSKCNLIHIEFKNINFNFTDSQFSHFAEYLNNIDGAEWENKNRNTNFTRKILIPIGYQNINILLNNEELTEFKCLLKTQQLSNNYVQQLNTTQCNFLIYLN